MKYIKVYNYTIKEIFKLKKVEDRIDNLFLLICLLIWRFSAEGKCLEQTLRLINEFDFKKNFGKENEDGKVSKEEI